MPQQAMVVPFVDVPLDEPQTAVERWGHFVMKLIACDRDLRTAAAWARHVGVSRTALRESCRLARVLPHDARDFGRMLRAICRSDDEWRPEGVLNVADVRTLRKLEARAGFDRSTRCPPSVEEFLENQTWIAHDSAAMVTLRALWLRGRQKVAHAAVQGAPTPASARNTAIGGPFERVAAAPPAVTPATPPLE